MAVSSKVDMYGIHATRLVSLLRNESFVTVCPFAEDTPAIALVQSSFLIFRTLASPELLAKFPFSTKPGDTARVREAWARFEASESHGRLYVTTTLSEDTCGYLVRKLTNDEGATVWVQKKYFDPFALEASSIADFYMESIEYYGRKVNQSPVRIGRKEGHTCGYMMPFTAQGEQVLKR